MEMLGEEFSKIKPFDVLNITLVNLPERGISLLDIDQLEKTVPDAFFS